VTDRAWLGADRRNSGSYRLDQGELALSNVLNELFARFMALREHLLPAIVHAGRLETHPFVARLRGGGAIDAYVLRVLDSLLASAQGVAGVDRLMRKLAEAPDARAFWTAVTELTVVSRLVRVGGTDIALVPTAMSGRPDSVATLAGHAVYFEVTSLTAVNPRQRAHNELLARLEQSVEVLRDMKKRGN
jgi:hypothetical protein